MKIYIWVIILFLISCKRDEEVIVDNKQVLAGVVSENMVYRDFMPDFVIDTLPDTNKLGGGVSNFLIVDINNDSISDFRLKAECDGDPQNYFFYLGTDLMPYVTSKNKISINAATVFYTFDSPSKFFYYYGGMLKKLDYKQPINGFLGIWTTVDTLYKGLPVRMSWFRLASRNINHEDMFPGDPNNWRNVTNGYMGIRLVQGSDTLYGWVRMSVVGYTKIILHDCAYQTKK